MKTEKEIRQIIEKMRKGVETTGGVERHPVTAARIGTLLWVLGESDSPVLIQK